MKLRKHISKLLALGILTNNIYFNSSANTEIPNRYQTLEGEHITIDDSTEGVLQEIEIFGNTTQDENNLENIQSVGDLYVDENGNPILDSQGREQYKIDIVSQNKNLFNEINKHEYDEIRNDYGWGVVQYVSLKDGVFNVRQEEPGNNLQLNVNFAHPTNINGDIGPIGEKILSKGDEYTFSYNSRFSYESNSFQHGIINLRLLDKDGQYISSARLDLTNNDERKSIVIKNISRDVYYVLFHLEYGGNWALDFTIWDMMFASRDSNIEYVEPTSYTTSILLPTQLQKAGFKQDRLYWDNEKNKYVIEKNVYKFEMNGIDNFPYSYKLESKDRKADDSSVVSGYVYINKDVAYTAHLGWGSVVGLEPLEGYSCDAPHYLRIYIDTAIHTEVEDNLESMNDFINKNPFNVYGALINSQLIETNITSKLTIPTYDGVTHIFSETENGINPTLKVTVDRLPQVAKNAVIEAETNSSLNNISLARMYINMLPESTYKDQLQEQLSQVFSSDMVLDRESATANLDVYIKSENMLSMSLDTNSVTFDGYSGAAPMELKDAVNITINSSLPYDLNAYMPTEISNSDGSSKIDFDIFNIKESTETNYNQFIDTTNKVVLKRDCAKGNGKSHKIDLKLDSNVAHKADIYKTVIRFEAQQK